MNALKPYLITVAALLAVACYDDAALAQSGETETKETEAKEKESKPAVSPHTWNSLAITFDNNPALAGFEHKHHVFFDFDRPWFSGYGELPSANYRMGYDLRIKTFREKFKLGAGVYYSANILTFTKQYTVGIANSFAIKFKNESELSIGVSFLALHINSIDYTNLRFADQFDGMDFNPSIPNFESLPVDHSLHYGPLNVGVWYRAKNFFVAASFVNLTVLHESSLEGNQSKVRTPLVHYLNAGYHFNIKDKITITPSVLFRDEVTFSDSGSEPLWFHSVQPRLAFSFVKNRVVAGAYYEDDRLFVLAGVDLLRHWVINLDLGWWVIDEAKVDNGPQMKIKTRLYF